METLWFCLVAFMIAVYVVLDGFDLGAGVLHLWSARNEQERRLVLRSIGTSRSAAGAGARLSG